MTDDPKEVQGKLLKGKYQNFSDQSEFRYSAVYD